MPSGPNGTVPRVSALCIIILSVAVATPTMHVRASEDSSSKPGNKKQSITIVLVSSGQAYLDPVPKRRPVKVFATRGGAFQGADGDLFSDKVILRAVRESPDHSGRKVLIVNVTGNREYSLGDLRNLRRKLLDLFEGLNLTIYLEI